MKINSKDAYKNATLEEIVTLMQSESPYNMARKIFSNYSATIEQDELQRKPMSILERRKLEFEAVEKIIEAYNNQVQKISMYNYRDYDKQHLTYEEWSKDVYPEIIKNRGF